MKTRVVVLGAGFGGLELATRLSETLGDEMDLVLVDRSDAFVFGHSKLDVMFGRMRAEQVRHPYRDIAKPGVRFVQSTVRSIDPVARTVRLDAETLEADVLVVALGADCDSSATPGLREGGHEFYTISGAFAVHDVLERFAGGPVVVGVCGMAFKCPPAPSETALLLDDYLTRRGIRARSDITVAMPATAPVPPSPETSSALLATFAERGIAFVKDADIGALDPVRRVAVLRDGRELPCALFLGVPVHRVPQVVVDAGLAAHASDWVPVNPGTLQTKFPDVYAIGDVSGVDTPKAGVFAEGAARTVADGIIARIRGHAPPPSWDGQGACYVEFGRGHVGRVHVGGGGTHPAGTFQIPSLDLAAEKSEFRSSRVERWFGTRAIVQP